MKRTSVSVLALILLSFSFANAQSTVSLTIESTLSGEDEKKVVEVPKIQFDEKGGFDVTVPVPFGDSYWVCAVDKHDDSDYAYVSLTDPGAIQQGKDGSVFPMRIFSTGIPVVWNETMTILKIGDRSLTIKLNRVEPPEKDSPKAAKHGNVPADILKQMDSSLSYDKKSRQILAAFYNPTQYRFTQFTVQIIIPKSEGFPGLDRLYQLDRNVLEPISEAGFAKEIIIPDYPEGTEPKITIKGATGIIKK